MTAPDWSPTFIGVGAEKSATTWCAAMLDDHPDVCMSQPKEVHYFDEAFDRGVEWYRKHFRRDTARASGEFTPVYMDDVEVCERIAASFPKVTILAVLRNPRERALSHLAMDIQNTVGTVSTADRATWRERARSDHKYVRRSLYGQALAPYFRAFPREQTVVLFVDDLERDTRGFVQRLYRAVDVSSTHEPSGMSERLNKTRDYRNMALLKILSGVSRGIKSTRPGRAVMERVYRHTRWRERLLDAMRVDRGRPAHSFHDVFGPENEERIRADLKRLREDLGVVYPAAWDAADGEVP